MFFVVAGSYPRFSYCAERASKERKMNRVAIRRDGREERIMDSVDEGIMGKAGGSPRNTAEHTKRGYCGGDYDDSDYDGAEEGEKERKNAGRKTTDKIASSNAGDDGRGKNCTHLIYAAAFLPWQGGRWRVGAVRI